MSISNPVTADIVLLDEYWTPEIVNMGVVVTEVDVLETKDPTQAKSGECSVMLENKEGWPSVRFRGGAWIMLSEIPPGNSEAKVWYRTSGWDGKWRIEIWTYYHDPSTPIPLKALEAVLDGGGDNGKLIPDDKWHQARAILQKGDGYEKMPKDIHLTTFVWFSPQVNGWDTPHKTYLDRVEINVLEGPLKGKTAPEPAKRIRPRPGAQTVGKGWIWWEAEDAVKHTFPPGGVYNPDNVDEQKILSNGSWLHYHGGENSAMWNVDIPEAGKYTLWVRGLFWFTVPFKWRWDEGDWNTSKLGTKQNEQFFRHVPWGDITLGWLNLGDLQLTAGKHSFEIETPQSEDTAFDCWLLTKWSFMPDGINKPK